MDSKTRNWSLLAEGAAIVVSILLAFAIDAWWQSRGDREAEQSALKRLIVEFEFNLVELEENRELHQTALDATRKLLTLTRPDQHVLPDAGEIGAILFDCFQNPTINPRLGTTNSLIASGDLKLIRDEELQAMLTEWPASADDLLEWQIVERTHGEQVLLPFTYDFLAWPDLLSMLGPDFEPSRFDSDFTALFSSLRFEGMLNNRRINVGELVENIASLEARTKQLIARFEDQLDE